MQHIYGFHDTLCFPRKLIKGHRKFCTFVCVCMSYLFLFCAHQILMCRINENIDSDFNLDTWWITFELLTL